MKNALQALKNKVRGINKLKAVLVTVNLLVVTLAVIYAYNVVVKTYNHMKTNWDTLKFAYEYPELVNPLKDEYYSEHSNLKDSMIKKQTIMSEFVLDDGSKKE